MGDTMKECHECGRTEFNIDQSVGNVGDVEFICVNCGNTEHQHMI